MNQQDIEIMKRTIELIGEASRALGRTGGVLNRDLARDLVKVGSQLADVAQRQGEARQ